MVKMSRLLVIPQTGSSASPRVTFGVRSVKPYANSIVILSIPELGITSQPLALGSIPAGTNATTYVNANWSVPNGIRERWYPFNLGTSRLYNLTITLDP
ncbi:hypothetical protein HD554DRAFT_1800656 [Boletus coccyginus]|nr:hypothetical protein HD554DRAFT_1800656 [Boletus coccyginus]